MAFPDRSKWLRMPIGWKDLGKVPATWEGYDTKITKICPFDDSRLRLGVEGTDRFWFCPKCDLKFTPG